MKFELNTENVNNPNSFSYVFRTLFIFAVFIIFCDVSIKLGIISRHYQIDNNCRILAIEQSPSIFKKLSRLSNLKSKKKIWEYCREVVK